MARGWLKNPVFGNRKREPFCRAAAWAWMIEEAAYELRKTRIGGKVVELQRGQFSHSLRFMAEAWGWHRNKVARFIDELGAEGMIERCPATVPQLSRNCPTDTDCGTAPGIITICNYDVYQAPSQKRGTPAGTLAGQTRDRHGTDLNKETNTPLDSSLRSESLPPRGKATQREFEDFWSECPRKVGKDAAARKYVAARRQTDAETLLDAMRRYAASVAGGDREFIVHPATWLHQGRWKDELPNPEQLNGHDSGPRAPPTIKPEYLDWLRDMGDQEPPH